MEWQHRIFQISLFHYHQICTIRFIDKHLLAVTSTRGLRFRSSPTLWNAFRPQEKQNKTNKNKNKNKQTNKQTNKNKHKTKQSAMIISTVIINPTKLNFFDQNLKLENIFKFLENIFI